MPVEPGICEGRLPLAHHERDYTQPFIQVNNEVGTRNRRNPRW
jgi:hypothetical protein